MVQIHVVALGFLLLYGAGTLVRHRMTDLDMNMMISISAYQQHMQWTVQHTVDPSLLDALLDATSDKLDQCIAMRMQLIITIPLEIYLAVHKDWLWDQESAARTAKMVIWLFWILNNHLKNKKLNWIEYSVISNHCQTSKITDFSFYYFTLWRKGVFKPIYVK